MIESKHKATSLTVFYLVGSRQHGVAAKSIETDWLTDRLLNAHGNSLI